MWLLRPRDAGTRREPGTIHMPVLKLHAPPPFDLSIADSNHTTLDFSNLVPRSCFQRITFQNTVSFSLFHRYNAYIIRSESFQSSMSESSAASAPPPLQQQGPNWALLAGSMDNAGQSLATACDELKKLEDLRVLQFGGDMQELKDLVRALGVNAATHTRDLHTLTQDVRTLTQDLRALTAQTTVINDKVTSLAAEYVVSTLRLKCKPLTTCPLQKKKFERSPFQ